MSSAGYGGFAQGMAGGMQAGMSLAKLGKGKKADEKSTMADGMGATQEPGFELGKPLVQGEMGDGQIAGEQPQSWGALSAIRDSVGAQSAGGQNPAAGAALGGAASMAAPAVAQAASKNPEAAAATALGGPGMGLSALALGKANDKGWFKGLLG